MVIRLMRRKKIFILMKDSHLLIKRIMMIYLKRNNNHIKISLRKIQKNLIVLRIVKDLDPQKIERKFLEIMMLESIDIEMS